MGDADKSSAQRVVSLPPDQTKEQMNLRTIQGALLGILLGAAVGIGAYTFAYAKGWSYMTDDASACANCHIMSQQYNGWLKSSHRAVTTCNSCHTPKNLVGKYATKASNGFWHSFYFTTGLYEDNIQIKAHSLEIVEQACRNCHEEIVGAIEGAHQGSSQQLACLRCHKSAGHLE